MKASKTLKHRSIRAYKRSEKETLNTRSTEAEDYNGMGQQSTLMVTFAGSGLVARLSKNECSCCGGTSDPFYGAPTVMCFPTTKYWAPVWKTSWWKSHECRTYISVDSCTILHYEEVDSRKERAEAVVFRRKNNGPLCFLDTVFWYPAKPRKDSFLVVCDRLAE